MYNEDLCNSELEKKVLQKNLEDKYIRNMKGKKNYLKHSHQLQHKKTWVPAWPRPHHAARPGEVKRAAYKGSPT